jgi:hypothetical protein
MEMKKLNGNEKMKNIKWKNEMDMYECRFITSIPCGR